MTKLSIITINLNNLSGLQKTMQSVFAQTFTDYEYIIIDGESCDGSKEVIEKHQNKLVYWVSEKDTGIYNAMNKAVTQAKGEYLLFLNSGDYFCSNEVLKAICADLNEEDIIYGNIMIDFGSEKRLKTFPDVLTFAYFLKASLPHPATFIHRSLFNKTGLFKEDNKIVSDWEFFITAFSFYQATYKHVHLIVSNFDSTGVSSTRESVEVIFNEKQRILSRDFKLFLDDYKKAEETVERLRNAESKIQLHENSRLRKLANSIKQFQIRRSD
jgi:glycosyltransferase involved in cell wall biosynthesis